MSAELRLFLAILLAVVGWSRLPAEARLPAMRAPSTGIATTTPQRPHDPPPSPSAGPLRMVANVLDPASTPPDARWLLIEVYSKDDAHRAHLWLDATTAEGWTDAPGWTLRPADGGWSLDLGELRSGSTTRILVRGHALHAPAEPRPSMRLSWNDAHDVLRNVSTRAGFWREESLQDADDAVRAAMANAHTAHQLAEAVRVADSNLLGAREGALHAFLRP